MNRAIRTASAEPFANAITSFKKVPVANCDCRCSRRIFLTDIFSTTDLTIDLRSLDTELEISSDAEELNKYY